MSLAGFQSRFRRYGGNVGYLAVEKGLRLIVGFSVGIYVARSLGPDGYGALNYAISFAAIFAAFATLGLDAVLIRELVRSPEDTPRLLGTATWLRFAGAVVTLVALTLAVVGEKTETRSLVLLVGSGIVFAVFQLPECYFQARVEAKYIVFAQILALLVVSGIKVLAVALAWPLTVFAGVEALSVLLTAGGGMWFFWHVAPQEARQWRWEGAVARRLLRDSWPLWLAGGFGLAFMRLDQLMLKSLLGDREVGLYSVAVRLVELFYFVPTAVCATLFPAVVRSRNLDAAVYHGRLSGYFSLLFWMSLLLTGGGMLLGMVIPWLYGSAYRDAQVIYLVYMVRVIFCSMGVASGYWLLAENLQRYPMFFSIAALAINAGLNYILIEWLGGVGAAWSSVLTLMIWVYGFPWCFQRTRPLAYFLWNAWRPGDIFRVFSDKG